MEFDYFIGNFMFIYVELFTVSSYYLFCFCFFFWPQHTTCGILVPQPAMEPTPPAVEAQVSTTGPPGKSPWEDLSKVNKGKIKILLHSRIENHILKSSQL